MFKSNFFVGLQNHDYNRMKNWHVEFCVDCKILNSWKFLPVSKEMSLLYELQLQVMIAWCQNIKLRKGNEIKILGSERNVAWWFWFVLLKSSPYLCLTNPCLRNVTMLQHKVSTADCLAHSAMLNSGHLVQSTSVERIKYYAILKI